MASWYLVPYRKLLHDGCLSSHTGSSGDKIPCKLILNSIFLCFRRNLYGVYWSTCN
uniref:Uncharacterized protein n=1 Tax=Arundo donax TaxID=35708 RepID=A0A0A8XZY1_ARUDO